MFSVNCLAFFSVATSERHWLALKHLISYLEAIIQDTLVIEADLSRIRRRSEYMAVAFGAKDFTWVINNFGCILGGSVPTLYSDNMAASKVAGNDGSRKKARHIEREFHIINELVVKKKFIISWVKSLDQLADVLTKNWGANKVEEFKMRIGSSYRVRSALITEAGHCQTCLMSLYTFAKSCSVAARIKEGQNNVHWAVVDVRDSDFIGGHIPGCHHVPSSTFGQKCPSLIEKLTDVKCVIFHCALSQQRGPQAAKLYAELREDKLEKGQLKSSLPFGVEARARQEAQEILILQGGFTKWVESFKDDPALVEGYDSRLW
ncbi:hypothetical protein O181_052799 [Austropuccinia psidii MF-1]|uniref:Rhodanese domain-containing protein n=1 Tax=Austropuccinia psidii MF-1 TaxID=1389203 RepID=A0A9Q3HS24_9BASI|nr:hypothetical protein [Austropuccinia psidii MF-1]